jgi:hypothetical protein
MFSSVSKPLSDWPGVVGDKVKIESVKVTGLVQYEVLQFPQSSSSLTVSDIPSLAPRPRLLTIDIRRPQQQKSGEWRVERCKRVLGLTPFP